MGKRMLGRMRRFAGISVVVLVSLVMGAAPAPADDPPAACGILFYSPGCGHCREVMVDHLPGIFEAHGGPAEAFSDPASSDPAFVLVTNGTFELLMANVQSEEGAALYDEATAEFGVPPEMMGVPRLVIHDEVLVGTGAIAAGLPGLIEDGLEAGGVGWPDLDGLQEALATIPDAAMAPATNASAPTEPATTEPGSTETTIVLAQEEPTSTTLDNPFDDLGTGSGGSEGLGEPLDTIGEKFRNDLAGNILAVVVLAGMLASLAAAWVLARRGRPAGVPDWVVPVLALAGAAVAVYLTYVETSGAEAVCGPVGNCNAVQESKFALLFGVIHVGLVGLISYGVVLVAWFTARLAGPVWSDRATAALALGAAGGVAFSIYLTFLEPFVIGATCIWCLSSAIIVTALLWVTAAPGWSALQRLRDG